VRGIAAGFPELLEPLEEAKDLAGRVDGGLLPADVVERDVVFLRIDRVRAAAGHVPHEPAELNDEDEEEEDELRHHRRDALAPHEREVARRPHGIEREEQQGDEEVPAVDVQQDPEPAHRATRPVAGEGGWVETRSARTGYLCHGRHHPSRRIRVSAYLGKPHTARRTRTLSAEDVRP
jgi:hypothetical protein